MSSNRMREAQPSLWVRVGPFLNCRLPHYGRMPKGFISVARMLPVPMTRGCLYPKSLQREDKEWNNKRNSFSVL